MNKKELHNILHCEVGDIVLEKPTTNKRVGSTYWFVYKTSPQTYIINNKKEIVNACCCWDLSDPQIIIGETVFYKKNKYSECTKVNK